MARARTLRPTFFTNDHLATCDPLEALLFAGLWTEADRMGRLEDRPVALKMRLLPMRNCDVEKLLTSLERAGLIKRYTDKNRRALIWLPKFVEQQRGHIHPNEVASQLEPHPDDNHPETEPEPPRSSKGGQRGGPRGSARRTKEISSRSGSSGSSSDQSSGSSGPTAMIAAPANGPPEASFRDQLKADFRDAKRAPYAWHDRDTAALTDMERGAPRDEIRRRWRIGLRFRRFPRCSSLEDLQKFWNHYATPDVAPVAGGAAVSVADKDWSGKSYPTTADGQLDVGKFLEGGE